MKYSSELAQVAPIISRPFPLLELKLQLVEDARSEGELAALALAVLSVALAFLLL